MSWSELDTALKARAQADSGNELLYFDTKCSAFYEACELPKKLSSTNIRVIASDQPSTTMVDRSDSPMRAMLEGILEQEDYEAIGQRLKKAPGFEEGGGQLRPSRHAEIRSGHGQGGADGRRGGVGGAHLTPRKSER